MSVICWKRGCYITLVVNVELLMMWMKLYDLMQSLQSQEMKLGMRFPSNAKLAWFISFPLCWLLIWLWIYIVQFYCNPRRKSFLLKYFLQCSFNGDYGAIFGIPCSKVNGDQRPLNGGDINRNWDPKIHLCMFRYSAIK